LGNDVTTLQIVATDGGENYTTQLQPVQVPTGRVALVVVLIPESPTEQKVRTLGYQQFEQRKARIIAAVPWAEVIPYFDTDYNLAFEKALARLDNVRRVVPSER
jgi:hypothetical protein